MPEHHRAIVSIDADDIFRRLVVTLWSYTPHHSTRHALEGLVKALYGRYLTHGGGEGRGGEGAR